MLRSPLALFLSIGVRFELNTFMVRKGTVLRSHLYISLLSILILVNEASASMTATLHIDLVLLRGSSLGLSHHLLLLLLILLLVANESTWHDDIHWVVVDADPGATRRTLVQQSVLLHPAQAVD